MNFWLEVNVTHMKNYFFLVKYFDVLMTGHPADFSSDYIYPCLCLDFYHLNHHSLFYHSVRVHLRVGNWSQFHDR